MTKNEIALQLTLKAMDKQPTMKANSLTKFDENDYKKLAESNGNIIASLYNTIVEGLTE